MRTAKYWSKYASLRKVSAIQTASPLRGSAVTVTGPATKVEAFAVSRKIIHRVPFGGITSVTLLAELTPKGAPASRRSGPGAHSGLTAAVDCPYDRRTNGTKSGGAAMNRTAGVVKTFFTDKSSWLILHLVLFFSFTVNLVIGYLTEADFYTGGIASILFLITLIYMMISYMLLGQSSL